MIYRFKGLGCYKVLQHSVDGV